MTPHPVLPGLRDPITRPEANGDITSSVPGSRRPGFARLGAVGAEGGDPRGASRLEEPAPGPTPAGDFRELLRRLCE